MNEQEQIEGLYGLTIHIKPEGTWIGSEFTKPNHIMIEMDDKSTASIHDLVEAYNKIHNTGETK